MKQSLPGKKAPVSKIANSKQLCHSAIHEKCHSGAQ